MYQKYYFKNKFTKIGHYGYRNVNIFYLILNPYYTLMSRNCTIFRNYFSTMMASTINKCIELKLKEENLIYFKSQNIVI